jgi:hypothetical protein
MALHSTLDQYYEKRSLLEGLIKLQFEYDSDLFFLAQALSYVTGQQPDGVGNVARPLTWGDNAKKFFAFLDDFDSEMLPDWRNNRGRLWNVVSWMSAK